MTATQEETRDADASAKERLAHMFSLLNITKVVYVDDLYDLQKEDGGSSLETVAGWIAEALSKEGTAAAVRGLLHDLTFDAGEEVWRDQLADHWGRLGGGGKGDLRKALIQILDIGDLEKDVNATNVFKGLMPSDLPVLLLSPAQWGEAKEAMDESTYTSRVLCFLDVNFDYTDATTARDGIELLRQAVPAYNDKGVIFGVYSHTFEIDSELDQWRELASDHDELEKYLFLPLAKARWENASLLAKGIAMTALNVPAHELKTMAADCIGAAHEEADRELRSLEVYDLEEMVLKTSRSEGVWEGDTLLRLYGIFHEDEARRRLLRDDVSDRFAEALDQARKINESRPVADDHPPKQLWGIRHKELYQDAATLNESHTALRTGDLFQDDDGGLHVLVAQPCDLMVRRTGDRSAASVVLLPVGLKTRAQWRKKERGMSAGALNVIWTLPYIDGTTDNVGYVEFKRGFSIDPAVLDLAVLDREGRCVIDVSGSGPPPTQMSSSWKQRRSALLQQFQSLADRLRGLTKGLGIKRTAAVMEAAMPAFTLGAPEGLVRTSLDGDLFTVSLRRVAHLRTAGSTRLLDAYGRFLARDASPHDYARNVAPPNP